MAGTDPLANRIRSDVWFNDPWHFPGMARAAEIIEGVNMISPQEKGASITEVNNSFQYWNTRIRADVEKEVQAELEDTTHPLDESFANGLRRAIEIIAGA